MTIDTIFNEGDQVFFLINSKVVTSVVRGYIIEKRPKLPVPVITYLCHESPDEKMVHIKVLETSAFATKDLLLKSL